MHLSLVTACLLLSSLLLAGCLGQEDDVVVEYRLRCSDASSEGVRDCDRWATADRIFFQLDMQDRTVARWIEDEAPRRYTNCTIYNTDHWSCAAEIGMEAVEFKQGRRVQSEDDRVMIHNTKRVTWFEWWSTWARNKLFG